jgi:hypothetical protein
MQIFPSRTDADWRASPVRVAGRLINAGVAVKASGFSASLEGAGGSRFRKVDGSLDGIAHGVRESGARASVKTQRPEFLFDLHYLEASGRRPDNGGGDARHGPLDQILPTVIDSGTPGDPVVSPDLEEIRMALDKNVLPPAACLISCHPPTPTRLYRGEQRQNICHESICTYRYRYLFIYRALPSGRIPRNFA